MCATVDKEDDRALHLTTIPLGSKTAGELGGYGKIMKNFRLVVLDKSYLQGCTQKDLQEITENNRLLVTAHLGYEIFTDDRHFKNCVGKLIPFRHHIDLINPIGTLYRFEREKQKSCMPLSTHFFSGILNENFNFKFDEEQQKHLQNTKDDYEIWKPKEFEKIVLEIRAKSRSFNIQNDVRDPKVIRKIYQRLKTPSLPPSCKLNEKWAIFRKLQVDLIAAEQYWHSYNGKNFNIRNIKKSHDQIDFRICVFASLTEAVATNDKTIKRYFSLICPEGTIYSLD